MTNAALRPGLTRVMTWVLVVLSAAFFFVRDFRSALRLAVMEMEVATISADLENLDLWVTRIKRWGVSQEQLRALAARAQSARNAKALAFAALHLDDPKESFRDADAALAIDPGLTWIGESLVSRNGGSQVPEIRAAVDAWAGKMVAAEPDNAFPLLLQANVIKSRDSHFPRVMTGKEGPDASPLATQSEWLALMEKAFSRPHYHDHVNERFVLDRDVMKAEGWDTPPLFLGTIGVEPWPNGMLAGTYASYKVNYLGRKAEQAHQEAEALRQYQEIIDFGQRMTRESSSLIDRVVGVSLYQTGAKAMAASLDKSGKKEEAAALTRSSELARLELSMYTEAFSHGSADQWAQLLFPLLTAGIAAFGGLTLLAILYINLKRWVRPEVRGRVYRTVSIAENYLPVVLFADCLALFLVDCPYANNFYYFMTAADPPRVADVVYRDSFPLTVAFSEPGVPFHVDALPYVYAAAAGLIVLTIVFSITRRRAA